jgi:hypothetical protein
LFAERGKRIALPPRCIGGDPGSGRLVEILPNCPSRRSVRRSVIRPNEELPLRGATFSDFLETYVREIRPF